MINKDKKLVICGVVAGIYTVLTVLFSGISYGGVQFRVAEAMMLLCVLRKEYCFALSVGCLVSNMFSPVPLDMIIGTSATVIAVIPMCIIGKFYNKKPLLTLVVASVFPVISNAIIVGFELNYFFAQPFVLSALRVAFGEFVCVTLLGTALFRVIEKNKQFMRIIRFED